MAGFRYRPAGLGNRESPFAMDAEDRLVSFDQFRRSVRDAPLGLIGSSSSEQTFSLLMEAQAFDDIGINHFAGSDHTVESHAAAEPSATATAGSGATRLIHLQLGGSSTLEQDGRTAALRPGDVALYSPAQPFSLAHGGESVIIRAPMRELHVQGSLIDELVGVRLDRERALVQAMIPLARHLGSTAGAGEAGVGARTVDAAITMIGAIIAETGRETGHSARRTDFDTVLHYIEENLPRPDLAVAEIAAANFMSPRKLHALFERQEITVAAWVRSRRLHHCRRELADTAFAGLTIAQIAARWGFTDAAHFSRAFSDRFGASPRAFRTGQSGSAVTGLHHRTRVQAVGRSPASPPARAIV